ncbi:LIC_10190 family membrane protein [Faecalibacter bovis]|uniref:DUF8201 domain-containing protein n=1 Tax=Faecalibacter bovis TaxID=2898187 RepID=A0ABX7XC07_9FLAO|nr:hypothetical protein [Faecalibacter bovis]QTV05393.1 hypothetical protein J9309_11540 [Faecalibacter bovis]
MFFLLVTVIVQLFVIYSFSLLAKFKYNSNQLLSLELLKGLSIVGIISCIISFFLPLNITYEICLIISGILLFITHKAWLNFKKFKLNYKWMFSILMVLTLFVGSMNAFIYDTFLYYLPSIKWLDDYGLVKGLANFDFNLGQMSLWHILQASFNNTIDFTYKINVTLVVIFLIYLFETKQEKFSFFLPLFYFFIASPSTELPVFIFSVIVILNYLNIKNEDSIYLGIILAAILVLIKPLSIVLPFFFLFLIFKELKRFNYKVFLIIGSILLIFLSKNYYLTGNLFFPLKSGITNNIHSVSVEMYKLNDLLVRFLIISKSDINNLPAFDVYEKWTNLDYYKFLVQDFNISIKIYFTLILTTFIFTIYFIVKKNIDWVVLGILIFIKMVFLLNVSMQYRFVFDGLLLISCVFLYNKNFKLKLFLPIIILASFSFVFSKSLFSIKDENFVIRNRPSKYKFNQLILTKNRYTKGYKSNIFNFNTNVNITSDRSLDLRQPTIASKLLNHYLRQKSHPELINPNNIKSGFKMVQNREEDIKEIEKHLDQIRRYRKEHRNNNYPK